MDLDEAVTGVRLRNFDFNLLIPLHALLMERSVTRAAERMLIGQPAMSASLSRLRRVFNDPLLVRIGRRMELTPLAESLLPQIDDLLAGLRSLLGTGARFEPASDHRVFTIVASDYVIAVLLRPLIRELGVDTPNVRIKIVPVGPAMVDELRRNRYDLLIWPSGVPFEELSAFPNLTLFTDEFVAVVDEHHPEVGSELPTAQLSALPYIRVGGPSVTVSDAYLDERGVHRQVAVTTESFLSGAVLVPGTRLVLIMQRRLYEQFGRAIGLRAARLDPGYPLLTEAMYWHPGHTIDPGHRWLRERVQRLAANL
ncbi:LysR family transcriptional regulator [Nocardia sp. CA-128927]|uniref:LysR family transcriptional regulator n=1 Tax=Nocardia sp. CA-128927 TaxID=3239975 RepID=UPI003D95708B